jgi:hypothetical protein
VLIFLLSALSAISQEVTSIKIAGIILDEKNLQPLPGASILLVGESIGTLSDENGSFSIWTKSLPATLSISFLGIRPQNPGYSEPVGK